MDPTPPTEQDLQTQLDEARATIARLERRARIDELLRDADALDLETARLLTELTLQQMDQPDLDAAVADLRRHKPWLFHRREPIQRDPLAVSGESIEPDAPADAARHAATTGDRRDLLRYLRLRRPRATA